MKKIVIVALCVCLIASLTACSQHSDTKEPATSQSQLISESQSIPGQEADNPPPVSSDTGEPSKQDSIADYEYDIEQPDPTLPENQEATFYKWDHVEYKKFGDVSTYQNIELELHDYQAENNGKQAEVIEATMRLPSCCLISGGGVIDYDGNFANGNIKIGGTSNGYYKLGDGESIMENSADSYSYEFYTMHPLSGEKYIMVETQENQVGGYYQTQKFVRYIGAGIGLTETNLLQYVIVVDDNTLTDLYFYVSPKATAKDLEIYDAIANSVEVAK